MPYFTVEYEKRDGRGEHILTAYACIPAESLDHAQELGRNYVCGHTEQCDFNVGLYNKPPNMALTLLSVYPSSAQLTPKAKRKLMAVGAALVALLTFTNAEAAGPKAREVNPSMTVTTIPADTSRTASRSFNLAEGVLRYLNGNAPCATLNDHDMRQVTTWLASGHDARLVIKASDTCQFIFQREVSEDGRM